MGLGPHDPWCSGHGDERPQVERERSAAAAMLGLPGFVVLAVSEHDGELEQAVETTAGDGWCPSCGVRARLHARRDLGWWKKAASYEAALAEVSTIRLLTERDFRKLFPEARVFKEQFYGLTKSFIAHHGW